MMLPSCSKIAAIFTFILFFSCKQSYASEKINKPRPLSDCICIKKEKTQTPNWDHFFQRFIPVVASCVIGSINGAVCAYAENKGILPWPVSWILFLASRDVMVSSEIRNMELDRIPHNPSLMLKSAWLADWATYLILVLNNKQK